MVKQVKTAPNDPLESFKKAVVQEPSINGSSREERALRYKQGLEGNFYGEKNNSKYTKKEKSAEQALRQYMKTEMFRWCKEETVRIIENYIFKSKRDELIHDCKDNLNSTRDEVVSFCRIHRIDPDAFIKNPYQNGYDKYFENRMNPSGIMVLPPFLIKGCTLDGKPGLQIQLFKPINSETWRDLWPLVQQYQKISWTGRRKERLTNDRRGRPKKENDYKRWFKEHIENKKKMSASESISKIADKENVTIKHVANKIYGRKSK